MERRAYTVAEAAVAIGVSRASLYPYVMSGELRSFKLNGSRRIAAEDLDEFVRRKVGETAPDRPAA